MLAGCLLGAAIITSSYLVGDSLRASVRDVARTELGPVDELVQLPPARLAAAVRAVRGALPADVTGAAGGPRRGRRRRGRSCRAPSAAARDGRRPGALLRRRPGVNRARRGGDTARRAGSCSRRTRRPRSECGRGAASRCSRPAAARRSRSPGPCPGVGVAGLGDQADPESVNGLVAPGTIARMSAGGGRAAQPPEGLLLIANGRGVFGGVARTDEAAAAAERALAPVAGGDRPAGEARPARAGRRGRQLVHGDLRRRRLGRGDRGGPAAGQRLRDADRRAQGAARDAARPRPAAPGDGAGLRHRGRRLRDRRSGPRRARRDRRGRLVVGVAARIFQGTDADLDLRFAVDGASVAKGFAIGAGISLVTVWVTSARISRLNIIRAVRDLPAPPWRRSLRRIEMASAAALVLGVAATVAGIAGDAWFAALDRAGARPGRRGGPRGRGRARAVGDRRGGRRRAGLGRAQRRRPCRTRSRRAASPPSSPRASSCARAGICLATLDSGVWLRAARHAPRGGPAGAARPGLSARPALPHRDPDGHVRAGHLRPGLHEHHQPPLRGSARRYVRDIGAGHTVDRGLQPRQPGGRGDARARSPASRAVAPLARAFPEFSAPRHPAFGRWYLTGFDARLLARGTPSLGHARGALPHRPGGLRGGAPTRRTSRSSPTGSSRSAAGPRRTTWRRASRS